VRTSLNVRHHLSVNVRGSNIFIFRDREFLTISLFLTFSLFFSYSLSLSDILSLSIASSIYHVFFSLFLPISLFLTYLALRTEDRQAIYLSRAQLISVRTPRFNGNSLQQHTATHCNTLQQPATISLRFDSNAFMRPKTSISRSFIE